MRIPSQRWGPHRSDLMTPRLTGVGWNEHSTSRHVEEFDGNGTNIPSLQVVTLSVRFLWFLTRGMGRGSRHRLSKTGDSLRQTFLSLEVFGRGFLN